MLSLHNLVVSLRNLAAQELNARRTIGELKRMEDRQLQDLGILRCNINKVAREAAKNPPPPLPGRSRQSRGGHLAGLPLASHS